VLASPKPTTCTAGRPDGSRLTLRPAASHSAACSSVGRRLIGAQILNAVSPARTYRLWAFQPVDPLGTVVPKMAGVGGLTPLLAAAAEVDAEFVLALGDDTDLDALGALPANVGPVGWVPLHPLLTRCTAVVHHGGSGTTLTTLAVGLPQLVLPHGADQFINADVVAGHRLGLRREPEAVDSAAFAELLRGGPLRAAAQAGADRVRALPAPASLVPRLEALAGTPMLAG
jgi:UDP:flavonoid glycosyltransferase YjiC (YdhE family)